MQTVVQNFLLVLSCAYLFIACDGDVLFRTKPCDEGMVRQGSACVVATKSALGECLDPNLEKLQKGEITTMCDGSLGEGKLVIPSDCTKDGEQDCVAKSKFKVVNTDNLLNSDIKNGKVVAGLTGSLRAEKSCQNYSALATFDSSYPPSNFAWDTFWFAPASVATASNQITFGSEHGLTTNSMVRFTSTGTLPAPLVSGTTYYAIYISNTAFSLSNTVNGTAIDLTSQGTGTHTAHDVPDSVAQYFDTIDDHNNHLAFSPANNPWNSTDYLCDSSNFVNVTTTVAPLRPSGTISTFGDQPFTQIWQDQISGKYISNILSSAGNRTWSDAVRLCESINGGTAGDGWRLPTQKELMQLYIHGVSKVALAGGSTNSDFWSASGLSALIGFAWNVNISTGYTYYLDRSFYNAALCIR